MADPFTSKITKPVEYIVFQVHSCSLEKLLSNGKRLLPKHRQLMSSEMFFGFIYLSRLTSWGRTSGAVLSRRLSAAAWLGYLNGWLVAPAS
jgi:hypothetical protein